MVINFNGNNRPDKNSKFEFSEAPIAYYSLIL